jgi:SAM-dependent methyltransferase
MCQYVSKYLERQNFLIEAHRLRRRHFQEMARCYDDCYGRSEEAYTLGVAKFLSMVEPGKEVLDAGCGTGNYFSILAAKGHVIFGIDDSAEMLAKARVKFPRVPTQQMALQDLARSRELRMRFAGLVCIDAMEWVMRDDWPIVLAGFRAVLKPHCPIYVTVELPNGPEKEAINGRGGSPIGAMLGEITVETWYNYFPSREDTLACLSEAGLGITAECAAGKYWHILLTSA